VAGLGREKVGKTWWLSEIEFRGHLCRLNTVFFGVGDMSRKQMVRRRHCRLSGKSWVPKYCVEHLSPVADCVHNQDGRCSLIERVGTGRLDIQLAPPEDPEEQAGWRPPSPEDIAKSAPAGYHPCSYCQSRPRMRSHYEGAVFYELIPACKPLSWREGLRAGRAFNKSRLRGRDVYLECYPTGTMSVADLRAQLDIWETMEGWTPDLVVIDYADILAPEPGTEHMSTRDQQNANWKAMRRLSMEKHCLVVTVTQSDAAGLEARSLRLSNFSEDKRKYSHATAFVSIQKTPDEERRGLARMGLLLVREGELRSGEEVTLLQDLRRGNPMVASYW